MPINTAELSTRLAERTVEYFTALLLRSDDRYTFEDRTDELQIMMGILIGSLRQLADRAGISWKHLLAEAAKEHRLIGAAIPPL